MFTYSCIVYMEAVETSETWETQEALKQYRYWRNLKTINRREKNPSLPGGLCLTGHGHDLRLGEEWIECLGLEKDRVHQVFYNFSFLIICIELICF